MQLGVAVGPHLGRKPRFDFFRRRIVAFALGVSRGKLIDPLTYALRKLPTRPCRYDDEVDLVKPLLERAHLVKGGLLLPLRLLRGAVDVVVDVVVVDHVGSVALLSFKSGVRDPGRVGVLLAVLVLAVLAVDELVILDFRVCRVLNREVLFVVASRFDIERLERTIHESQNIRHVEFLVHFSFVLFSEAVFL